MKTEGLEALRRKYRSEAPEFWIVGNDFSWISLKVIDSNTQNKQNLLQENLNFYGLNIGETGASISNKN